MRSGKVVSIDLAEAKTFDVVAVLRLISIAAARREERLDTLFRLPTDKPARHTLRLWQFPAVVEAATRAPLRLLVPPEQYVYFGEERPAPRDYGMSSSPRRDVLTYLTERHSFGMRSYSVQDDAARSRMLDDEVAHWTGYALSQLLSRMLKGSSSDIIRVLVLELVSNLASGPAARMAVVGSQLEFRDARDKHDGHEADQDAQASEDGVLTLAAWHSGRSVISTLRAYLADADGPQYLRYVQSAADVADEFVVHAEGWTPSTDRYDASWHPGPDLSDQELLIAGLFAATPRNESAPENAYGLYALYKTVIDVFGGAVEVSSARTRLRIRSGDPGSDGARYVVHVASGPDVPLQIGDLLSVRLPVHDV
jgi:hypothetical protein